MASHTVGVHEAKTQFSRLLHDVEAGEEVLVTRGGTPVARIVPVIPPNRIAASRGMFAGRFRLPDDFEDDEDELGDLFGLPR
ncbi:MAG: type II toxin-antitoxin system prevent-host-death family antitoxin [Patulibacter sp.]|nr:type II toxin-antitoxin system prevent-host-death family antitoxin [Patulibacter sp.]